MSGEFVLQNNRQGLVGPLLQYPGPGLNYCPSQSMSTIPHQIHRGFLNESCESNFGAFVMESSNNKKFVLKM